MKGQQRRGLCLLVTVTGALVLAAEARVEAEPALVVAWWTRQPAAAAPAGGFQVADAPDGPVSVAALRLPAGARSLRMPVADATLGVLGALRLCPASSPWAVAAGGALAAAPSYDCSAGGSVLARRDGDGWVAELGVLERAASSRYGIVVVPEVALVRRPFVLVFAAPQVEVRPSPSPRSSPGPLVPVPRTSPPVAVAPSMPRALVPLHGPPYVPPPAPRLAPSPVPAPARAAASARVPTERSVSLLRRLLLVAVAVLSGLVAALGRAVGGRLSPRVHRSRPPASLQPDGAS